MGMGVAEQIAGASSVQQAAAATAALRQRAEKLGVKDEDRSHVEQFVSRVWLVCRVVKPLQTSQDSYKLARRRGRRGYF